jgi:hypothetical protein
MVKSSKLDRLSDQVLRALLKKHECPLRFHEVRARFMGNIATPDISATPMQEIRALWGGELPEFDSAEDAESLITGLTGGLWNGLTKHQSRRTPFQLTRIKAAAPSYEHLARLSKFRREELDGFIEGLFVGKDYIELPETAHKAVGSLSEIRAMMAGTYELCACPPAPASTESLAETLRHIRELSRIAEAEINTVIQSCKAARAHMRETFTAEKPDVLH